MRKKLLISGIFWLIFASSSLAQTQQLVDSLLQNLSKAQSDTDKVAAMLSLSAVYRTSDRTQAIDYAEKAIALSKVINYPKGHSEALFNLGAIQSGLSDYTTALKFYQQAYEVAKENNLKRETVQYKLNIGIVNDITGAADKAMILYKEVLDEARAIQDTVLEFSAFQNMAILHVYQGELQKAKGYFLKAKVVVESIDHQEMIGQITNNLATVYAQLYDFDSARYYYAQSLDLWRKRENDFQVARTLYNMAIDEKETGSGAAAEQLWLESLNLRKKLGDIRGLGLCQSALGSLYSDEGDLAKAVDYFRQSLRSFEKAGLKREIVSTYTNQSLALRKMGNAEESEKGLKAALDLALEIDDLGGIANAYHHLGVLEMEQGNMSEADKYLDKSCTGFAKLQNWEGLGKSLHIRGKVAENQGFDEQALNFYRNSWQTLSKAFKHHEKLAEVYTSASKYYLKNDDRSEARKYQELALRALLPENDQGNIPSNPVFSSISLPSLLEVMAHKARILIADGANREALQVYDQCFGIIDSLQKDFRPESQQILLSNAYQIFDGAIETIFEQYLVTSEHQLLDKAFEVMENYKGLLLEEALHVSRSIKYAGITDTLVNSEEAFRKQISFLKQKMLDAASGQDEEASQTVQELQSKLFQVQQNYDSFKELLQTSHPNYYHLRYQNRKPDIAQVREMIIGSESALVEYFVGKEHLFALAISDTESQLVRIPNDKKLSQSLQTFYLQLSNNSSLEDYESEVQQYAATGHSLYKSLLEPLALVIQGKDLIIIPDGQLHYIPFAALVTRKSAAIDFANLPYLVRDVNISYYYSAELLKESLSNPRSDRPRAMLALTPEEDPGDKEFNNLMAFRDASSRELGQIPGAFYEVTNISEIVGADYYTGSFASETNFKELAPKYRVLHLAMHGIVDNARPIYSRLVFSADSDSLNDGLLHIYELYNMQLQAELVVLSACNTGFGTLQKGEGLLSLGRGFAYAGCPNILMSKWPAADQPTNELMQYFYKQIKDGVPKDEALRQAKLQYLNGADLLTAHPVYWANFVLMGNNQPVSIKNPNWGTWMILGGVLVAGLLLMVINAKKKRKIKAL